MAEYVVEGGAVTIDNLSSKYRIKRVARIVRCCDCMFYARINGLCCEDGGNIREVGADDFCSKAIARGENGNKAKGV